MHPYSIKSNADKLWYLVALLAFVSYLIFSSIYSTYVVPIIQDNYGFMIFLPPLIIFGLFYGLFNWLFDTKWWKSHLIQKKYNIPNLNGVWKGTLVSSYDKSKEIPIEIVIFQTWKQISITLKTSESKSCSLAASVIGKCGLWQLNYQFLNQPGILCDKEMSIHYGTTVLDYDCKTNTLEGYYYNKERDTVGELKAKLAGML